MPAFSTHWTDGTKAGALHSLIGVADVSSVPLLLPGTPSIAVTVLAPAM